MFFIIIIIRAAVFCLCLFLFCILLRMDSLLTLTCFLWHLKDIDVLCLFTETESNYRSKHSPFIFCHHAVYCVRVRGRRKKKKDRHTHCTHTHSVVWYLLSPLLTAAHKKFTESPPFCFHQHITLSSYYANEITAL